MAETQWMTLLETADMMKRLPTQVTRMCEDGKLEYYMEDGRYFVSRESIDLFMHPRTDGTASSDRDANGTTRRQYGRAPDDFASSSESAAESETVNVRDDADAAAEEETVNGRDRADAAGVEKTGSIVEEAPGAGDENAEAREDEATPEAANAPVDTEAREDEATPEAANAPVDEETQEDVETQVDAAVREDVEAREDDEETQVDAETREDDEEAQATGHPERGSQTEPVGDATQTEETLLRHSDGAESPIQDEEQAEPAIDADDPNLRAVEILADLRAAIARHAMEHKAFCDEIAGLADALESTLSRDDDKTSELTREISSLLARYTRR